MRPSLTQNNDLSDDYELVVRQEPVAAKVFIGKEKGMGVSSAEISFTNL
jgi:hypothetical protein